MAELNRHLVKQEFDRCFKRWSPEAERYRMQARVNESFQKGAQFSAITMSKGVLSLNPDAWFDGVPKITFNIYTKTHNVWCSLISKDRPSVACVAASEEPEDTFRAAYAQRIVDFLSIELGTAQKISKTVRNAALGGTAGLKAVFNADEDRIDLAPITVHDFLIDPSCGDDYRNARGVIFSGHMDEEEAAELFELNHLDRAPSEASYQTPSGSELFGVECHEFWLRPCRKFPEGVYASIVADEIVELTTYPLIVETDASKPEFPLPLVLMNVLSQNETPYGLTSFSEAVTQQRELNECVSLIVKIIRQTSNYHLKVPQTLADGGFDPSQSTQFTFPMTAEGAASAKAMEWTVPPQLSTALTSQRDWFEAALEKVVGLNAPTLGRTKASMSGVAIEHVVELDAQANSDTSKSLELMVFDLYKLLIAYVRRFYTSPRQQRITNGDAQEVLDFSNADFQGVDIRVEPASEIDKLSTIKKSTAAENLQAGTGTQLDLDKATNAASFGMSKQLAEQMLAAFLAGDEMNVSPGDVNFDVLDEVVAKHKARALSKRNMPMWLQLDAFLKSVEELRNSADNARPVDGADEQDPEPNEATQ